jgi:hypothetical protein
MIICLNIISQSIYAFPENLNSAIDYAKTHHPAILDTKLDLEKIEYDLEVESERFYPKLFWFSEGFYEKQIHIYSHGQDCFNQQGMALGPLMHWHLPMGSQITGKIGMDITQDLQEVSRVNLIIKQPLLKHRSKRVNENGLIQNKIQQDILRVNDEKTLEEVMIQVSTSYFNYAQALLTDRIREKAVEEAKKYLYQVNQLIASGRLPKNEAEQPALFVETLQSQKEESNQQLAFHYLQLMRAMGVVEEHVIQKKAIEQREENITQEIEQLLLKYTKKYNQEIKEAYPPVDKQEKLFEYQFKLIEQNKVLAKDETKWNMNIAGHANIWEKEKQYGVNVSLDFPINDKLKRYQSLYHLQVEQHKLKTHQQLHRYYFPKELIFKRQEVESKFKQLALATKRKELAAKSLNTAELKWQAGRITMFEVIHLATQLQETNLGMIEQKINVLNAGFDYFKSLGILPNFWMS